MSSHVKNLSGSFATTFMTFMHCCYSLVVASSVIGQNTESLRNLIYELKLERHCRDDVTGKIRGLWTRGTRRKF